METFEKFKKLKINNKLIIKLAPLIFAVVVVIGIYYIYTSVPRVKNAIALATTVKPETLTELYFEDHINLPAVIKPHENYKFTFTIHNLEYKTMNYSYVVYLQAKNKKIVLNQGGVNIENGGYASITEYFGPLTNTRMKITVELVNKNQLIDFWMEPSQI